MWLTHPQQEEKIEKWWNQDLYRTKIFQIHKKLNLVKEKLKVWSQYNIKHIERDKVEIKDELDHIEVEI